MARYPQFIHNVQNPGKRAAYKVMWRRPWTSVARNSKGFKWQLKEHGYLSPNFKRSEASGKRRDPVRGSDVPDRLFANAQRHAFNLERFRHYIGDKPVKVLSWYRDPDHNRAAGGATNSRHMQADATDFAREFINSVGTAKFDKAAEKFFKNGGYGRYPSGAKHFDSRGNRARWSSF